MSWSGSVALPARSSRDRAVVLFDTTIGDRAAQGLNVVEFDGAGLIRDLTVFFRPLDSLVALAEAVGKRMEAQFGPPPQ